MKDFFISYTGKDESWAEWIASQLEQAGFTTVLQARDFPPGSNFVVEMHKAAAGSQRTLAVLSPDYLKSIYGMAEWAAAFADDPTGERRKLIPVRVRETKADGLLKPIVYVDLVGLNEAEARERLLARIAPGRGPAPPPPFPGRAPPAFPGETAEPPNPEAAAARLAELPLDDIPEPGALPPGSRMPLSRNPLFVGREDDLRTLVRHLKAGETTAVGQIAAATGLGGIGKTQLACELVHRYGRFFAGGVFWLSFADPAAIPAEAAACGRRLSGPEFDEWLLERQVRWVQDVWQAPLVRLLVFDNCEEQELLASWRPPTGGCRVLITSRRTTWDPGLGVRPMELATLPRPESVALLLRFRPDLAEDPVVLDEVAGELGDLPLALHLAGSFLSRYRHADAGRPEVYLEQLRQGELLDHPSLRGRGSEWSPTGHELHVARTFALSFERLASDNPIDALARSLLARAACFAPGEPIPRPLLLATATGQRESEASLSEEDALVRLLELGLAEADKGGAVKVHRLVAAFARPAGDDGARSAVEGAIFEEARRLNSAGFPAPLLAWQPHLRAVTDAALERADEQAARLCSVLDYHLNMIGDLSGARPYSERALAIREEVLGAEHPDTARSLNNLGFLLQDQGDLSGAQPYYERALAIYEKVLGAEHPDTTRTLNNLGSLLQAQGDFSGARPYLERAMAIREKVLGAEHPDTARSLNNLGFLLKAQGDLSGAQPYLERALAIREKVLGAEHPDTAQSLNNLSSLLQAQGDLSGARPYLERALAIREKVLGAEHPHTAQSLNNLGSLLKAQGDLSGARPYLEHALAIREKVLGAEHPDTASGLNNLGSLLQAQGDLSGARPYYERALAIVEKVLGGEHPDIARILNNLGGLLRAQGDLSGARPYYERALAIAEKVLGAEHLTTEVVRENLASLD